MKRTISLWLRWVGVVLMVLVAGWASAQPVTPPLPSTAWSRGYMTNTTPAAARTYLGLAATNVAVTLLPYASQFETNGGVLALSATVSNQLAAGASAVQASDLPVASVDAAARQLLFTLPTDDPTMLGAIHPSCWYGSTNWNGYKYWLAYTTWPGVEREAIYLAVSHDGETWLPAPGTTDGRIGPNGADTEVQMLDDGSLCIYYLYAGVGGTTNNIDYLRSFDGTTWTTNRAFTVTNALAVGSAACPSIVREPDGTWRMWWHDKTFDGDGTDGDPYSIAQVYTLTSTTGTNWDITTAAACPGMTNGWHLDVARIGTNYYMLRCNEAVLSQGAPRAYTSPDGTNWTRLPGAGFQMPPGLLGPYRADIIPVNSWPPAFDVWWNSWDAYSATADATNSTSRVGRSRWIELPYAPLDWSKSNTLTMANTFFGSDSSASTVLPFAYPWSVAGVGALKMKYVANLGSGGLLYTNDSSGWGIFGLDAFGYKYDAAGSLGGGLFQSYETAPKSPSQFRVQWQIKLLTNSAAQIGLYKYGTFGSSVGSLTNIMVSWNTTGTNMAWLCVTNGSTSQRVAFDGVPSVAGTSHTANSALVEIEKTEWGKITARIYSYPNTYTATAAFADTTALWWTPFVAWKGTNGLERFDLRTKVNNARGASEFPSSAGMSVNAISMMTNGPVAATRFIGDGSALTNLPDGRSVDAGSVPVADRLAFAIGNGTYVRATVHPNAVWLPTNWNGAQIWLAFTGTTNQTETTFGTATEDPFIYASADGGNTWVLKSSAPLLSRAASCTLAGWSTNGWQADPEIYLDTNGVMRVIWMGFHTGSGGVTNAMFETSSTDGTTWSTPTLLKKWKSDVGNPWSTNATCAGPQIVTLPGGGLRLYYTDDSNYGTNSAGAATNTLCYVSGLDSSGTNWDWGTVNRCALTPYLTNSVTPWHFDIALVSSNRWFLGYGSRASSFIEYATSTDGITWSPPGMGFLLPLKQKAEEYGYYKLTWQPVAGPNGIAWNVIANHTGTNQLLVNGWNFSLVRGLEPEPQALTYTGANTNWLLVGGTKTYNGINRIGALTVVDDFKGTSSGKVGIGQPFNGWGGIAIGYNAPMDATNYTLASDGTSPRLNAKTGGTVGFAVNNTVVAGVNTTAITSSVPFVGPSMVITGAPATLYLQSLADGTPVQASFTMDNLGDFTITADSVNLSGDLLMNPSKTANLGTVTAGTGNFGDITSTGTVSAVSFAGDAGGVSNLVVTSALPTFYNSKTRQSFLWNEYDDANVAAPTGDTRGMIISADHSSLVGGRFNQGLNTGTAGTYSGLCNIQYGILWGWNALALGLTNSSPADAVKGAVNIGYNNFVGKQYGAVFGYNNAVVGSASFAAGGRNIVGSTSSLTNTPIVSHVTNVAAVVLQGNVTNVFTNGATILISQNDGVEPPELQMRTVMSGSFDGTNSTIGINTNLSSLVNANSNGWAMVVGTSGTGGQSAALGFMNRVFGPWGFAAGSSNSVRQSGIALGLNNTVTGDLSYSMGSFNILPNANGITLGTFNTLGAFNNATAIGMSNTVSRTRATAIGVGAYAPSYGELAFANGWKATVGDSQIRMCIQRRSVAFINTNWFNLYNDSAAEGFNLQNSGLYAITARVVGKNSSTTKLFDYELKGLVKRAAGTATEIYPAVVTTNYSSVATIELGLDVSAGTAIYLRCRDTAAGGDTIYWVAKLEAVELVY